MKKVITLVTVTIFAFVGLVVYANAGFNIESMLKGSKRDMYLVNEAKVQKAEEAAAKFKESDKNKLPPDLEKYLKTDEVPVNEQAGLVEKIEVPSAQIPMHSIELKDYNFTNRAFTLYNIVVAGASTLKPDDGVLLNFYINPKTGEPSRNIIQIPDVGKITITGVSDDKKTVTFKTEKGDTGIFDGATDRKGTYKINNK